MKIKVPMNVQYGIPITRNNGRNTSWPVHQCQNVMTIPLVPKEYDYTKTEEEKLVDIAKL